MDKPTCINCGSCLGCGAASTRYASDGREVCTSCINAYEQALLDKKNKKS